MIWILLFFALIVFARMSLLASFVVAVLSSLLLGNYDVATQEIGAICIALVCAYRDRLL